jgi:hypothetical protein
MLKGRAELARSERGVQGDIFEDLLEADVPIVVKVQPARDLLAYDMTILDTMFGGYAPDDCQPGVRPELPQRPKAIWYADDGEQLGGTQFADVWDRLKQIEFRELRSLREQLLTSGRQQRRKCSELLEMSTGYESGHRVGQTPDWDTFRSLRRRFELDTEMPEEAVQAVDHSQSISLGIPVVRDQAPELSVVGVADEDGPNGSKPCQFGKIVGIHSICFCPSE